MKAFYFWFSGKDTKHLTLLSLKMKLLMLTQLVVSMKYLPVRNWDKKKEKMVTAFFVTWKSTFHKDLRAHGTCS